MPLELSGIQVQDTKVFWMPEEIGKCPGLRFLRSGLYMGELLKKRFEPSQAFAMTLKKEEYASVLDLPVSDGRVIRYLKGETIETEERECSRDFGWQLVCVDGYPLGWGKLIRGTLRNKYFSGWRMNAWCVWTGFCARQDSAPEARRRSFWRKDWYRSTGRW